MTNIQISLIFFCVGVIAVVPVLYYYYRRNPNPRFRPPVGEMAMISIFALLFIGGGSYFMGTVLKSNPQFDDNALKQPLTNRAQDDSQDKQKRGSSQKSEKSGNKSPFGF